MSLKPKLITKVKSKKQPRRQTKKSTKIKSKKYPSIIKRSLSDVAKVDMQITWAITNETNTSEQQAYHDGVLEMITYRGFPRFINIDPNMIEYHRERHTKFNLKDLEEQLTRRGLTPEQINLHILKRQGEMDVISWLLGETEKTPAFQDSDRINFEKGFKEHDWEGFSQEYAMKYGFIKGVEEHWTVGAEFEEVHGVRAKENFEHSAKKRLNKKCP